MTARHQVEPIVLERIEIRHDEIQYVEVPEELEDIREVAQWVTSFGDTEVRDIGTDGFRYRTVAGNSIGSWAWIEPGMWLARYEHEFDIPHSDCWPWGDGWEQKSGPARPPQYGYDPDDEDEPTSPEEDR